MNFNLLFLILVGSFVGAAAGYLGSFMVLKRMSLVGDALSHVALPGMAIAIVYHVSPMLGAFIALTCAVVGVWYLEKNARLYPETLVGIFFTASLAIGLLITPQTDILEALFGSIEKITPIEGILAIFFSCILILVTFWISQKVILGIISEDLARANGIKMDKINLIYHLLTGAVVAIGVTFVGTLLMGALVIIPAASGRNISKNIKTYYLLSLLLGILSAIIGLTIASYFHISPGPIIVLTSVLFFILSLLFKHL